jgi:poly-gamma-glutamate synthesis protein (capsule biosynthesis protein)
MQRVESAYLLRIIGLAMAFLSISLRAQQTAPDSLADPRVKDTNLFDARRPVARELETRIGHDFTLAVVGDLIISRPVSQSAQRLPGFAAVLQILHGADVSTGNMESTIFDARTFKGAPYSWDGDWTNSSLPQVAKDLGAMGFTLVSRANNHALDWGLEGMRETSRHLDDAGIAHAGVGENRGLAAAPGYIETPKGRIALVSIASTFRPTTDALPAQDAAPGRPGLNALHVSETIRVPKSAMQSLASVDCTVHGNHCHETPATLKLFDQDYRIGDTFAYEYTMDPEDLSIILRAIRSARQNADFVVVALHSHECSLGCDDPDQPRGPGDFLKTLAHEAIDSGADVFFTTGNHNLGPLELYRSPHRGIRPIFYGLGNFFWSDVQELLPHDLYQRNRALLGSAWVDPSKATPYDLSAPLNKASFAHDFTFRSVIAVSQFDGSRFVELRLYPIEEGYGDRLTDSGIPRLAEDPVVSHAIIQQIMTATARFGLPSPHITLHDGAAVLHPGDE